MQTLYKGLREWMKSHHAKSTNFHQTTQFARFKIDFNPNLYYISVSTMDNNFIAYAFNRIMSIILFFLTNIHMKIDQGGN